MNSYNRQYYLSRNLKYRLTLDNDLEYYLLNQRKNSFSKLKNDFRNKILELKYLPNSNDTVEKVTNQFPFRITKSSKYITGLQLLNDLRH